MQTRYDQEEPPSKAPEPAPPAAPAPAPVQQAQQQQPQQTGSTVVSDLPEPASNGLIASIGDEEIRADYDGSYDNVGQQEYARHAVEEDNYGPIGIKEDG